MSFLRLSTATLVACSLLAAAPVWAAETPAAEEKYDLGIVTEPEMFTAPTPPTYQVRMGQQADLRSPWLAAGLSLVGPLMMAGGAYAVSTMPSTDRIRINGMSPSNFAALVTVSATPLGLGFGHAYAGDPWRGLAVGLVSPLTIGGVGVAGLMLERVVNPGASWSGLSGLVGGMVLGAIGHNIWAASDAYATTERRNQDALGPMAP